VNQYSRKNWITLAALSVVWGFSFILMKIGLKTFSWDQVASMRISVSFAATMPILLLHYNKIRRSEIKYYCMTGFFGSGLPAFCFTYAQTHLDSGITGVLNSMTPAFTFILGAACFGMTFQRYKLLGVLIAMSGAIILVSFDSAGTGRTNLVYALPVLIATISYAISANIVKRFLQDAHPLVMGAMGFLFMGIPAATYLITTEFWNKSDMAGFAQSAGAIIVLAVFGTVVASMVFYWLIQKTDSLFGSLVTYLIPIVAVLLGILDRETITLKQIGGMLLILTGIYIINQRISTKKPL